MGCIVNGPGEAKEADVGIAGSGKTGALFVKGRSPRKVEGDLAQILIEAVREAVSRKEASI
jgi:(E)-4-hydroxy-3-methylbut-2-enyl-diphosphate synthase